MCGVLRLYIFAAHMVLKHSDRKERGGRRELMERERERERERVSDYK